MLLMKICLKTFLLFPYTKKITNSCCSLFRFMDMTWSILDHKEKKWMLVHSAALDSSLTCTVCSSSFLTTNSNYWEWETDTWHSLLEIRRVKTWKTESLNVVTDLTTGIRGEKSNKPLFKVFICTIMSTQSKIHKNWHITGGSM